MIAEGDEYGRRRDHGGATSPRRPHLGEADGIRPRTIIRRTCRQGRGAVTAFFAKRLFYLLLTMVVVSLLLFLVNELTPGDVARKVLGPFATQGQVDLLTEQMGLNRPVWVRYAEWVWQLLHGDLGYSSSFKHPVNDIIWDRLGNTLILASLAFGIIVPASIILGVAAGMREAS